MRPTTDVVLTLDARPGERAAWDALARKEQRLVRDREKLPTAKWTMAADSPANATTLSANDSTKRHHGYSKT